VASNILAEAAFREGKDVQAFPYFGVERRGAPVTAFTKIDDKPIRVRSQIYEPDYVIVLDQSLLKSIDVAMGMKPEGIIIVNIDKDPEIVRKEVKGDYKIATVDATGIAIRHKLGTKAAPIVNTAILGAFSKVTGLVNIDSIVDSIKMKAPLKKDENARAAVEAFENVKM
jgi:2-oxoacid:acceptor oxidoreductase gamma subunit (pyruvate/2-ketoisovalerate family)